ncbi:GNAT family N-acetyltransferase [Vallicoccus soli]|uniref:GNAT family N-acetyltransferase n=1 Tax=Vallicoccus soli TaxID=2339232 RepID=UPI001C49ADD5|nr:GNAT family N-acetyltransferase [Vallicoccus soli]
MADGEQGSGQAGDQGGGAPVVRDAPERDRYEVHDEQGRLAGFAAYQRARGLVVMTHTEVDPAYEGRGLGSALVRGALDDLRAQGTAVLPLCPFVGAYIARHPEYRDVVYRAPASRGTD